MCIVRIATVANFGVAAWGGYDEGNGIGCVLLADGLDVYGVALGGGQVGDEGVTVRGANGAWGNAVGRLGNNYRVLLVGRALAGGPAYEGCMAVYLLDASP